MNELVVRAETGIKEISALMAKLPPVKKWTPEMKAQAAQFAALLETAQGAIKEKAIAGIEWKTELETFLNYTNSQHTRRAYRNAIYGNVNKNGIYKKSFFVEWTERKKINPLELTAAAADMFINDMKAQGKAAASIRRDIAGISAFYSHLERSTDGQIKNPIRGTRQRPKKQSKKETVIPTAADMAIIYKALPAIERAIVITLASRGLRAGALVTLELKNKKYHGMSKGKALKENDKPGITLPQESMDAIAAANLDVKKPFQWVTRQNTIMTAGAIESRINKHIEKLYEEGKIRAAYSAHDFRHFFAVTEYGKTKDIYRVSMLLNHENIAITTEYLKSLEVTL